MVEERTQAHIEHLIKIGRQSVDELTQFEKQKFAGLLLEADRKDEGEEGEDIKILCKYLVSNDPDDEKALLNIIKTKCIDDYKNQMERLLTKQLVDKPEGKENE